MIDLFKLASERHDEIIKEAVLGAVGGMFGRAALGAGKWVSNNKMKTIGAALTVDQVNDAASGLNSANKASKGFHQALSGNRSYVG